MRYPIFLHKDENNQYGVTVPDIQGCYSVGMSYDDALKNATEAIECHLEGLLLDNEALPVASSVDNWIGHEDFKDGVFALIDIDLSIITGKSKRVNVTIPERVLTLIDLYGKTHPMKNRSAFLTDAALSYITGKD